MHQGQKTDISIQSRLVQALAENLRTQAAAKSVRLVETHISWVLLARRYAYKIKKAVDLGFLDFSSLEARHFYCEEEIRLNRRLAPWLYLDVISVGGSAENPVLGAQPALEYAVRMRRFAASKQLDRLAASNKISPQHIDSLAATIARFHNDLPAAEVNSSFGTADAVRLAAEQNFEHLQLLLTEHADLDRLKSLRQASDSEYAACRSLFGQRLKQGYVRECHGDLHLGNIVMLDGELTPFDCIEFNPALRWIDVMSEVAFLTMDLMDRGRADIANRFLNAYLEASGDYDGLDVLRFYGVYRAMVRAKVHALRATQDDIAAAERARLLVTSRGYVELAQACALGTYGVHGTQSARPPIILMHGLSGSGKSIIAQALAEYTGAIRLRSDIERKRLNSLAPLARSGAALASDIYAKERTLATYQRLLDLARGVTNAGYAAVVDATFLQRSQRDLFRQQAKAQRIPFVIVDVTAPEALLRTRIHARLAASTDASEADQAVLTHQLARREALSSDESSAVLRVDTSGTHAQATLLAACEALRERLAAESGM